MLCIIVLSPHQSIPKLYDYSNLSYNKILLDCYPCKAG